MFEEKIVHNISPISLKAEDSLQVTWTSDDKTQVVVEEYIATQDMIIDKVIIGKLSEELLKELGLRKSITMIFGESEK